MTCHLEKETLWTTRERLVMLNWWYLVNKYCAREGLVTCRLVNAGLCGLHARGL